MQHSAHEGSRLSDFFEKFTIEAKERAGQNERRVLSELLEHEDDPLYWLDSQNLSKDDTSVADENMAVKLNDSQNPYKDAISTADENIPVKSNDPSPPSYDPPSLQHSSEYNRARSPQSDRSPSPPIHQSTSPPLHSNHSSTLPQKWMSSFLSSSVPSRSPATRHVAATLSTSNIKHGIPRLTHSSPFASHLYAAPSGAPGFTGDHQWNKAGFEFEEQDKKLPGVELTGRRDSTTPVLTSHLADKVIRQLLSLKYCVVFLADSVM